MGTVDVECRRHVHTLTLNRPDKHNALDREMVLGLDAALRAACGTIASGAARRKKG